MQVNPINNCNFKGKFHYNEFADNVEVPQRVAEFDKAVKTITDNVHPATIFSTAVVAFAAATKGRKVIPYIRKAAVTCTEAISKGAVNIFGKAAKIFKKAPDTTKASQKITNFADKLRDKNTVNTKMIEGVQEFFTKILGTEKGQKVAEFMQRHELTNGVKLFDAAVATGVGLGLVNGTSDKVEEVLDKKDLRDAADEILGLVV